MDSPWTVNTFRLLNKTYSVGCKNIEVFDLMIWFGQHISHEINLQQSSNGTVWKWVLTAVFCNVGSTAGSYITAKFIQFISIWDFPHDSSSLEGGSTQGAVVKGDEGKNSCCYNELPGGFYSRVQWSVRTDRSQEKMGGNVWCPTMPISFGRRCKGQGVEVRNPL